ncbi:MAG: hypothetical protein LRY50_15065 [Geovibrio sp.]|nr:hypothetical protein [Geovibrio sp.]
MKKQNYKQRFRSRQRKRHHNFKIAEIHPLVAATVIKVSRRSTARTAVSSFTLRM